MICLFVVVAPILCARARVCVSLWYIGSLSYGVILCILSSLAVVFYR